MMYTEDQAYGITSKSVEFLAEHLPLIGKVITVRGRLRGNTFNQPGGEKWVVFGDAFGDKIAVSGFSWGYVGEGPRGLSKALEQIGFDPAFSKTNLFDQHSEWELYR